MAHHVKKIWFGLFLIVRTIAKPANRIVEKSLSIISSSKLTNGIVQNLYRFSINLLPPNVSERAEFVPCQFPTRRLGRLVNQRNPLGCWQVTGSDLADLGQIIPFYFGFFPS